MDRAFLCARGPEETACRPEEGGDAMETRTSPGELRSEAPAWQRVWLDSYPCDQPGTLPLPRVPVSALLETAARRFPDHVACTLYGKPTTFGRLDEQARRLAHALRDMGAGPGRFVGMLLPNTPEYLVALQAAWLT